MTLSDRSTSCSKVRRGCVGFLVGRVACLSSLLSEHNSGTVLLGPMDWSTKLVVRRRQQEIVHIYFLDEESVEGFLGNFVDYDPLRCSGVVTSHFTIPIYCIFHSSDYYPPGKAFTNPHPMTFSSPINSISSDVTTDKYD